MGAYLILIFLIPLCWNGSYGYLLKGNCTKNISRDLAEKLLHIYPEKLDDVVKDCAVRCVKNRSCEQFSHMRGSCQLHTRLGNVIQAKQPVYDDNCKAHSDCSYQHGHCLGGFCSCSMGYSYDFKKNYCVKANHAVFGDKCKKNTTCPYRHGSCIGGFCSCSIGYSYDFERNFCVKRCTSYGPRFTLYQNSCINGWNSKDLTLPSLESCAKACRDETTSVCINAEFTDGKCNLSDKTWAEVPGEQRDGTALDWQMLYRHCRAFPRITHRQDLMAGSCKWIYLNDHCTTIDIIVISCTYQ